MSSIHDLDKKTGKYINSYINNKLEYLVSLLKTGFNYPNLTHIKKLLGIPCQTGVQSRVWEPRFHKPRGMAKKKKRERQIQKATNKKPALIISHDSFRTHF